MKKLLPLYSILALVLLQSCIYGGGDDTRTLANFDPVIVTRDALENSVLTLPPQPLINSGKIYIKDDVMFINDVNKGFHVYDYSNPQNPVKIGFIQAWGATDLAMRANVIYVNQAVDLITLLYNPADNSITLTNRNREVFPTKPSPEGSTAHTTNDDVVIDWTRAN